MRVNVKKWGNSASVRIPAAVMQAANLQINAVVDVREDQGRILIEPVIARAYDLTSLLDAITPENLQHEISFGAPVGKEAL